LIINRGSNAPFFMEQTELNIYIELLQNRLKEYFNQSLIFEAKLKYQNEIITELNTKVKELQSQLEQKTPKRPTKKTADGGSF